MKIKQFLMAALFLGLVGTLSAQNNDNLRGRINDRPNQAVQRRPNAPQKTDQRMPDRISDCQRDGLHGEVKDVLSVMYEADPHSNAAGRGSIMERLMTVYKQNGQRRSQSYLSNEEDMIFKTKYKHDGFGLVTLEHILDPEENVIGRTYYLYDADLILTEVYVEDEIRYEYDEHNEPVSSTLYDFYEDPNEPELTITLFEYRYDEEGNWVTRYEYQLDNDKKIPVYIVERDIKYY